jgi:hypothetical protein
MLQLSNLAWEYSFFPPVLMTGHNNTRACSKGRSSQEASIEQRLARRICPES